MLNSVEHEKGFITSGPELLPMKAEDVSIYLQDLAMFHIDLHKTASHNTSVRKPSVHLSE